MLSIFKQHWSIYARQMHSELGPRKLRSFHKLIYFCPIENIRWEMCFRPILTFLALLRYSRITSIGSISSLLGLTFFVLDHPSIWLEFWIWIWSIQIYVLSLFRCWKSLYLLPIPFCFGSTRLFRFNRLTRTFLGFCFGLGAESFKKDIEWV